MPLTPEEQQELAQLHAKYAPQQSNGLTPEEQAELAQLHQKYGGQSPQQSQQQSKLGQFFSALGKPVIAMADAGANALTFDNLPAVMDARAKLVGGDTGADFTNRLSQERSENPAAAGLGDVLGSVIPGAALGAGIGSVLPTSAKLLPSAVRAAGTIAGGGVQGYLRAPKDGETRAGNAINTMESPWTWGPVGAIEGLNQGIRAGQGAIEALGQTALGKWLGGKLTKMTPEQVDAYHRDPALAEQVYGEAKNNPGALIDRAQGQAQQAIDQVQQNYIDPRKAQLTKLGVGKSFRVNPADFEGTDAHPVIQDAYNKQGNTIDVPLFQRQRSTQVPLTQKFGPVSNQDVSVRPSTSLNPAEELTVPVQTREDAWGPQVDQPDTFTPVRSQEIAKPMGDSVSMGMEPTLRAKRAASNAADLINQRRPLGISAADNDAAKANAQAAVNLGKATKSVPGVDELDDEIHGALGHVDTVKNKENLASLFSPDDNAPLGTAKTRAAIDFLDKEGGSNIGDTADALSAAKTLNSPHRVQGLSFHSLFQPAGKYLIKAGASPDLDKQATLVPEKTLQSLFGLLNAAESAPSNAPKKPPFGQ